jgi:DNA-binding transcriptional ArsR family regulator
MKLSSTQRLALAEMYALLGDPSRLSIVLACADGTRSVSHIVEDTQLSPSLVSHHLRLLRTAGLVRVERTGRYAYYSIADEHVRHMLADMVDHVRHRVA